ncbi:hypothetical protein Avbf_16444 [Armadillidium vulgare]|nr:hypothetical protein Avbf_16444 [Armadillidium vulgare]
MSQNMVLKCCDNWNSVLKCCDNWNSGLECFGFFTCNSYKSERTDNGRFYSLTILLYFSCSIKNGHSLHFSEKLLQSSQNRS